MKIKKIELQFITKVINKKSMEKYVLLPVDVLNQEEFDLTKLEIYIRSNGELKCIKQKGEKFTSTMKNKLLKFKRENKDKVLIKMDKDIFNFCDSAITKILEKEKDIKKALSNVKQLMQSLYEALSYDPEKDNFYLVSKTNEKLSKFIDNNPKVTKLTIATLKKDFATSIHVVNVHLLVSNFSYFLGMRKNSLHTMIDGAYFHDVGKIKIPDEVLKKPGKLTEEEYSIIKKHTIYGYEILNEMELAQYSLMALEHHEFIDGSGYPNSLKNGEISYEAKIIQICDIFEALIGIRPYRDPLNYYNALKLLKESFVNKGKIEKDIYIDFINFVKNNEK